ncbi:hypothetical protein D3C72_1622730 [compost metagenome]
MKARTRSLRESSDGGTGSGLDAAGDGEALEGRLSARSRTSLISERSASGFSRKSNPRPSRRAATASRIVACPERKITGSAGSMARRRSRSWRPSIMGSLRSVTTASKRMLCASVNASRPLAAIETA